ncbi:O-antigen/teichoic acid export membrane protein [Arthrobacter sp. 754]
MTAERNQGQERPVRRTSIIGRKSAGGVAAASVIAAASSYLVLMISARALGHADNAEFLAFWALMFCAFGITTGLQPEFTRHTLLSRSDPDATEGRGWRLGAVALGFGALVGLLVMASSPFWSTAILGREGQLLALFCAAGLVGHALQMGLTGTLAGSQRWNEYSLLIATEALARLGLVGLVLLLLPTVEGFAAASAAATFVSVLSLGASPSVRRAFALRSSLFPRPLVTGIVHAATSTVSSAILVVGFPVLLRLTTSAEEYLTTAPLLMATALTRAPLMVPLMTYQSVAVAHFMNNRHRGLRALWPIARIIGVVGVVGAVLAAWFGSPLMEFLLGPGYRLGWLTFAGLTLGAALLATLSLSGALAAALGRHLVYSSGWLSATALAVMLLLTPFDAEIRTLLALLLGPALGITVHVVSLGRTHLKLGI